MSFVVQLFERIDTNGDGYISFPEYLNYMSSRKNKLPANHVLNEIFESFDRNDDGHLNLNDLRHALLYLGTYVLLQAPPSSGSY